MSFIPRRLLAVVVAAGAMALAAPVAGASAQDSSGFSSPASGGITIGGNQIGSAYCVGTNRPAAGGNNGSTSASSCGGTAYQGAHYGQIGLGEPGSGTTIINSPDASVNSSSGSITIIG